MVQGDLISTHSGSHPLLGMSRFAFLEMKIRLSVSFCIVVMDSPFFRRLEFPIFRERDYNEVRPTGKVNFP